MKILNVVSTLDRKTGGGFVERTTQMSHALIKMGHSCSILTTEFNLTETRKKELSPVNLIVMPFISKRYIIPRLSFKKVAEAKKAIQDADLIHLIGLWPPINCFVFFYALRFRIPYVVCPAGTLKIYGRSRFLKKLFKFVIGKRILRSAKALIAVTELELEDFSDYGFSADKVNIIQNAINESDFSDRNDIQFREKYNIGNSKYLFFIGRMNHFKGPDLLLEAFINLETQYKDIHLVLAGPDENMYPTLKALVQKNKLESRVHIISFLENIERSQALHGCCFLVIPSRHDALPTVVLEAGIASKPVLITKQAGFSIIERINGGVVCNADVESLTSGVSNLLEMNEQQLNELGNNLFFFVKENYTWDVIVKKVENLYEKLIPKITIG